MSLFESRKRKVSRSSPPSQDNVCAEPPVEPVASNDFEDWLQALAFLDASVGESDDYVIRGTSVAGKAAKILFIETLSDPQSVEETLRRLQEHAFPCDLPQPIGHYLQERVLISTRVTFERDLRALAASVVSGHHVLLIDGVSLGVVLGDKKVEHRQPEQPLLESSVRGSQVGFVEALATNISLIRDSLHSSSLVVKKVNVGVRSQRTVAVIYLRDVANPTVIDSLMQRIAAVQTDVIDGGADIEQRIMGHDWSIFPLTRNTQRVDNTVREINQGKVAVVVDGDPSIFLVPVTIIDFFQSAEDYTHTFIEATFIRWLRALSFFSPCTSPDCTSPL